MSAPGVEKFLSSAASALSGYEVTQFIDSKGFSLIGNYTTAHKREMGIADKNNIVPSSKFYFLNEDIVEHEQFIPLKVRIASTVREGGDGGRYSYILDNSIFRIKPIELSTSDEFYVERTTGIVYEKKKSGYERIELKRLYERIYKAHISSIFTLTGLYRRAKIFGMRSLPRTFFSSIAWVSGYIFWWLKGKRYQFDVIAAQLSLDRRDDEINRIASEPPVESIDFFGYKVGVWTLTTFSIMVIFLFSTFKDSATFRMPEENILSGVYSLAVAIVSIVAYDKVLPRVCKVIVKKAENQTFNLSYNGVKFKI